MAIPAMALQQQHDARRDILIDPVERQTPLLALTKPSGSASRP